MTLTSMDLSQEEKATLNRLLSCFDTENVLQSSNYEINVETLETPKILYHYTSLETLISILNHIEKTKKGYFILRGTQIEFLNDETEFSYGTQVLNDLIKEYENQNPGIEIKSDKISEKNWLNFTHPDIFRKSNTFITSFSSYKDNLPMWYMYGDYGKGISIGIDTNKLKKIKSSPNSTVMKVKCKYEKNDFVKMLKEVNNIGEILYKIFDTDKNITSFPENISRFGVFAALCQYKDPFFKFEKEYRLIRTSRRPKNLKEIGLSKPYIENKIPITALKEIVIGPCKDLDLTKNTIEVALQSAGIAKKDVEIIKSEAPFRNI